MYYSKSTGGFYCKDIHDNNMPNDVVEITKEQHQLLLRGNATGKIIISDAQGYPILADPPKPSAKDIEMQVQAARAAAYATEADPLFFQFQRGEITKETWLSKVQEIKDRFPKT